MRGSQIKGDPVPQSPRLFAERLNYCLDEMGLPTPIRDRATAFSKMMDISKQQAWSLLEGREIPAYALVENIATELEVDPKWLCGEK